MPNKSSSIFQWIFLDCLPILHDCDNFLLASFNITDGNSEEYGSIDESIAKALTQAICARGA